MAYTEVTTKSWGDRLGGAFKGILGGIVLFLAATVLLWWNEGRTVRTGDTIAEARLVTQSVDDVSTVNSALENQLIHASARAETTDILTDTQFGVNATAISLKRNVEYYQWVENAQSETRKKLGGGEETVTTYTYAKKWVSSPISSGSFKDPDYQNANSVLVTVEDETLYAPTVTFGGYILPDFLKHAVGGAIPLNVELSPENQLVLEQNLGLSSSFLYENIPQNVHVQSNTIYLGRNPGAAQVGDLRVSFTQVPPAEVSIIAKATGDTFASFVSSNGQKFNRLSMGKISAEEMFADAESENTMMAWILRVVGALLVITGLRMILKPLSVLADVIPAIGTLVGMASGLVASFIGAAWSLLVIAIAWIRFRPVLAISLIVISAGLLVAMFFLGKGKKKQTPPQTPTPPQAPTPPPTPAA